MPTPPEPVMPMEPEVPEPLSIGIRLTIDGRQFEVDSVDAVSYTHLDVYKRQRLCR